ncbi:histidine phosphatase family protein [Saccharibacter sp. 17.LH.SD]|nr:histidine phosphatase family protein [Saccharibacter sp. 17.LH.SD]
MDPQAHFLDGPGLPSGTTRFWLIRHGVVDEVARQTMYGTLDVPLCPQALQTQRNAYSALAKQLPPKALWFSSPLKRAQDTGATIQAAGKISHPIEINQAFTEQSIGEWSGTPHDKFPSLLHQPPHPFWSISAMETPPGGENMETVKRRVGRALDHLAETHPKQDMIILSHGGAIRMALAHCLSISPDTALYFTIQNLSVSIIEYIEGSWRIICVNSLPDFGETHS